jgi:uncharacterized protein with von Willebrand factor type A (vWA) domain
MAADLVAHTARFAAALRQAGIGVSLKDEIDAVAALTRIDLGDRAEVGCALKIALKIRRRDWPVFEALFRALWESEEAAPRSTGGPKPREGLAPMGRSQRFGTVKAAADAEAGAAGDALGEQPGWSPQALLRQKDFARCTAAELAAMERFLSRLALSLATRPSRRRVPARGRGAPDLRRSLRGALGTGGELLRIARRARAVERPKLVVLCDTSGSMDAYARLLLAFVLSLKRAAPGTEVFAFNTALTRLTPWLAAGKVEATLSRLAREVPDWSGGTRIGDCLAGFVERYLDGVVSSKSVVLVLSDGLDRGDPKPLADALSAIRARAKKLLWLNPLAGDPQYQPTARGMAAALPFLDHLAPAHSLEALEALLPHLAA